LGKYLTTAGFDRQDWVVFCPDGDQASECFRMGKMHWAMHSVVSQVGESFIMRKTNLIQASTKRRPSGLKSLVSLPSSPVGFDLAISTVDRPKNYVHKLISHLGKNFPIRLIVGSPSYSYLERYRGNSNVEIIGVDPTEWDRLKGCAVQYRASWNYWRCFVYGVPSSRRKKGLLILEDDVIPAKGWEKRLYETIEQIEAEYGGEYVLSLYTYLKGLSRNALPGRYCARYPARSFGGTQAMYYPEPIRVAFSEYLKNEGVNVYRMPYDWLLSEYLGLTGIPLFVTTPCLYQHVGGVTTGLSWAFHVAGRFAKRLPRKT
jgi:hypothetical protein